MSISIIIPTYNEADSIHKVVTHLHKYAGSAVTEILVIDGGSKDDTVLLAESAGAKVVEARRKGRAAQMNIGAEMAKAEILYFLHADAFPPESYTRDIINALDLGYDFGNFRQVILSDKLLVKFNSKLSSHKQIYSNGGDQSLFIKKSFFEDLKGFNESFVIMEDYDFFRRARKKGSHIKIPKPLQVLDRKYKYNSYFRVNIFNVIVFTLYLLGASPEYLKKIYSKGIKGPRYRDLNA